MWHHYVQLTSFCRQPQGSRWLQGLFFPLMGHFDLCFIKLIGSGFSVKSPWIAEPGILTLFYSVCFIFWLANFHSGAQLMVTVLIPSQA